MLNTLSWFDYAVELVGGCSENPFTEGDENKLVESLETEEEKAAMLFLLSGQELPIWDWKTVDCPELVGTWLSQAKLEGWI